MYNHDADEIWNITNNCVSEIRKIQKIIIENKKQGYDSTEELKSVYRLVKEVIPKLYINGNIHVSYEFIIRAILDCENALPKETIMDAKIEFDATNINEKLPFSKEPQQILDYIVSMTRRYLCLRYSCRDKPTDINLLCLENECQNSSNKVKKICDNLEIDSRVLTIYPGYFSQKKLFNGNGFHMFNIVKLYDKKYIVDCSYKQFFSLRQNSLDRLGIVMLANCKAGIFMTMNDSRKMTAEKILKNGWVEFDQENAKNYFDGFTLSFRNGLYYEQTNDFSYETDYTKKDYIRFLSGLDNQLNYEAEECLGFQKRPLKDYKIKF